MSLLSHRAELLALQGLSVHRHGVPENETVRDPSNTVHIGLKLVWRRLVSEPEDVLPGRTPSLFPIVRINRDWLFSRDMG